MVELTLKINDPLEFNILQTYLALNAPSDLVNALQKAENVKDMQETFDRFRQSAEFADDYKKSRQELRRIDQLIKDLNELNLSNLDDIRNKAHQKLLKRAVDKIEWINFMELDLDVPGLSISMVTPKVNLISTVRPFSGSTGPVIKTELSQLDDKIYAFEMSDNNEAKEDFSNLFNFTRKRLIADKIAPQLNDILLAQKFLSVNISGLNAEVEQFIGRLFRGLKGNNAIWTPIINEYSQMIDSTIHNAKISTKIRKLAEDAERLNHVKATRGKVSEPISHTVPDRFECGLAIGEHTITSSLDTTGFVNKLKEIQRKDPDKFRMVIKKWEQQCERFAFIVKSNWETTFDTAAINAKETDDLDTVLNEALNSIKASEMTQKIIDITHHRIMENTLED